MGSGSKAASRKSTASWSSSSSWRSLLHGCLGGTMAAGENVPASDGLAEQPLPIVTNHDLPLAASNSNLHAFTFAELSAATEGFACCNQIGSGEFGTAYRGFIVDGVRPGLPAQLVAVKRTRWRVDDYVQGMVKEAMFLGELQLRHPCLVKMIGYCCEEEHRLLVYEFMAHGSLDDYFFKPFYRPLLPWSTRLSIVLATAKGLVSLHSAEKPLICGEFNASDILLDSDNNAKISLSGLRLDTRASDGSVTTTRSRLGTPRGSAPEYVVSGHLTTKCDVYSFGVLLLEILITGMKWIDMKRPEERDLLEHARPNLEDPVKLAGIMDKALKGIYPVAAAHKAALVTYKCLHVKPEDRPDMSDVMKTLDLLTAHLHRPTHGPELHRAAAGERRHRRHASGKGTTPKMNQLMIPIVANSREHGLMPAHTPVPTTDQTWRVDAGHHHMGTDMAYCQHSERSPSPSREREPTTTTPRNIWYMIGYCYEGLHRLLVYELMGHGSLANYLSNDIRVVLSWSTRLSIALATAKGLLSLHVEEKPLISVKFNASNILLDSYNNVKLSDLWFARKYGKGDDPNVYTLITSGYGFAPEYVMSGDFTKKSDVYCFGVVLLVILTGQRLAWLACASEQNLRNLRPRLRDPLKLGRVMDPVLKEIYPVAAAHDACMVAYRCLHASPGKRPSMLAVVEALDLLVGVTVTNEVDVGQTSTRP
ncbi:hypothetical protein CFC21_028253 [Triticum aestivum]|uniref:Protein kinase domain-containing protein n=2 Tax=Triticum aestivum TaxID=4565 RepID=A0A9R1EQ49_WHEAT|nr:hypothetical protein CFC21_028253 [Triticum aestivum]